MKFRGLSTQSNRKVKFSKKALRREVCRVAAAFDVRFFRPLTFERRRIATNFNGRTTQGVEVTWVVNPFNAQWVRIYVFGGGGQDERYASVDLSSQVPFFYPHITSQYNEILARGLFRLGFEEESVLAELPPLSAHEKMELRFSMPRQFWPKKWFDEEP